MNPMKSCKITTVPYSCCILPSLSRSFYAPQRLTHELSFDIILCPDIMGNNLFPVDFLEVKCMNLDLSIPVLQYQYNLSFHF